MTLTATLLTAIRDAERPRDVIPVYREWLDSQFSFFEMERVYLAIETKWGPSAVGVVHRVARETP